MQCLASFCLLRLKGGPATPLRALWLHRSCALVLRRLGFAKKIIGAPPRRGLVVSNHLSYLDILLYGASFPCVFVSKAEVRGWPAFGLLAALGGTVFIDRSSAASAAAAAIQIEELLLAGVVVLIFPEGTSSDGSGVLRFYPSLFEPAVRASEPVTAACIAYSASPDVEEASLCYYGDISFGPHLLRTLQLREVCATLRFSPVSRFYEGRKQAAAATREEVIALRHARFSQPAPGA